MNSVPMTSIKTLQVLWGVYHARKTKYHSSLMPFNASDVILTSSVSLMIKSVSSLYARVKCKQPPQTP